MSTIPKPPQIIPYLFYRDVPAALDFLCRAFGFEEEMRTGTPSGGMHGEASFHGQLVMMGQGARERSLTTPRAAGAATMGVFIYLDDVDAHYAAAKAAGAEIVDPPKDVDYGRTYRAVDPEGASLVLHDAAEGELSARANRLCACHSRPPRSGRSGIQTPWKSRLDSRPDLTVRG